MALFDSAYVPLAHHHVVGGDHDDLDDNVVYIQPSVLHMFHDTFQIPDLHTKISTTLSSTSAFMLGNVPVNVVSNGV